MFTPLVRPSFFPSSSSKFRPVSPRFYLRACDHFDNFDYSCIDWFIRPTHGRCKFDETCEHRLPLQVARAEDILHGRHDR